MKKIFNLDKELPESFVNELINIRRHLHMYPELSLSEYKTAEKIEEYLSAWNIPCERIAETGVLVVLEGNRPGKVVAIRADIDALPIEEVQDRPYRSKNDGVMHACGHDVHATVLLGAAKAFKMMEGDFDGTVKFFFQPAEEASGGAKRMIQAGCMDNPKVDHVIGLHVMPQIETGKFEFGYNAFCAMSCAVKIKIKGKSGHAAKPCQAVDAVSIAGQVITNLNMIVSRNVSPLDSVVLTFGSIHGGTKSNIIADEVILDGTLRTLSQEMKDVVAKKINDVANHVASAHGASVEVIIEEGYPALINDKTVVENIIDVASDLVGVDNVQMISAPSMGGEDFSFFSNQVPSAFYNIGCGNIEKGITASLHNNAFDVDETCIPLGVKMQVKSALELMKS